MNCQILFLEVIRKHIIQLLAVDVLDMTFFSNLSIYFLIIQQIQI